MRPPKLTADQIYTQNFVHSSHLQIPVYSNDIQKMKIPFVVAVTPFPRDAQSPPVLSYVYQNAPICKNCTAVASNRYIRLENNSGWLCQACQTKNTFNDRYRPIQDTTQAMVSVFDALYPRNLNEEITKIPNPTNVAEFFFLVIERSEATLSNGLFKATLDRLRQTAVENGKVGYFTVFVYDTFLHFPVINKDSTSFSISTVLDLEDAVLPPAELCFFQLDSDKELILKYFDYLETMPTLPPMIKLFDLVKNLNVFCNRARIPLVLITSQVEVGTSAQYRDLSIQILRSTTPMKFLCVIPPSSPPDFSPLSEFAMVINAKVNIFSQEQVSYLPMDIVKTLLEPAYVDVLLFAVVSPCLKIVDIKGNGLRRSEQSFTIPYLSLNDTIYVYLDYNVRKIDIPSPGIQFQLRYIDSRRQRFIRVMSTSFTLVDNMGSVANLCDYNVFIAASMIRCVDKAREFDDASKAVEELAQVRENYLNDKFARLFFLNLPELVKSQVNCALSVGKFLLARPDSFPMISGKAPIDISLFFAPIAYRFDLYSTQMAGPYTLSGLRVDKGALYVKLNNSRGLVLLSENEDLQTWVEAINNPPIKDLVATVCNERVIEIVCPALSKGHLLFKHVCNCIRTKA